MRLFLIHVPAPDARRRSPLRGRLSTLPRRAVAPRPSSRPRATCGCFSAQSPWRSGDLLMKEREGGREEDWNRLHVSSVRLRPAGVAVLTGRALVAGVVAVAVVPVVPVVPVIAVVAVAVRLGLVPRRHLGGRRVRLRLLRQGHGNDEGQGDRRDDTKRYDTKDAHSSPPTRRKTGRGKRGCPSAVVFCTRV